MIENQKIFVIDDDPAICEALRWLFESEHLKVETYENGKSYLNNSKPDKLGCIILDVQMPIMSGLELLDILKIQKNHLPVIMISAHNDVPIAVRAMKAGAIDFILKPINHEYLLKIIKECLLNQTSAMPNGNQKMMRLLSKREQQVLELIVNGKLNKEIAYDLHISLSTVEAHRSRIMHKFQVKNLAHLIRLYLQNFNSELLNKENS